MEKSMNMTINRLPAITWNRLKMNEAFVPDVKIPVAGTYEEQLGKHAAALSFIRQMRMRSSSLTV